MEHHRCRLAHVMLLVLMAHPAVAQDSRDDPIVADRPGQATGSTVVPVGTVQIETGSTVYDERDTTPLDLGEINLRWGMASRLELRAALNSYRLLDIEHDAPSGLEDPSVGVKIRLTGAPDGARPQMALIVSTSLPVGGSAASGDEPVPSAIWAADWELTPTVSLTGNMEYGWSEEAGRRFHQVTPAVSVGLAFSTRWSTFLEVFGHSRETANGRWTGYVDGGLIYLLTRTLALDGHVGYGFRRPEVRRWAGMGLSVRF